MSKKSTPGQSYDGLKKSAKMPCRLPSLNSCHKPKLGQNSKMSAPIRLPMTRRLFWALKIPQKLWAFEKTAATGPIFDEIKKFLHPSDRELPGDYFGLWNFWKRSILAWFTDNQSLVTNWDTFCPVFTPIRHFFWLSLFSLPLCTFLVISFQKPPSKIQDSGLWAREARSGQLCFFLRPQTYVLDFLGGVIILLL